ncbi:cox cluster protein [Haladaptatus pallidirubidus]|uniref:Cox cluster protein n=1 Tax=Haladaptatus pallidirubidus TaxID=1008152 RepID=A0AAV3UAS5_9EURY|nr:cox cluster protein [Haladaptatus pallidirubidus]
MPSRFHGRWLVVGLYVLIVSFAGFVGVLLGLYGPEDLRPVELFGLIELQPTPIGLAIFGMATIGLFLGVLLFLVMFVSERYDDADPKG